MQLIVNHQLSKEQNYWMQNLRKDLKAGINDVRLRMKLPSEDPLKSVREIILWQKMSDKRMGFCYDKEMENTYIIVRRI